MSLIPFILDLADELHEFSRCLANGVDINDFGFGLYTGTDQQQPQPHQQQQQQQQQQQTSPRRNRTSSFSSFWMPSKRHHPYNRIKTACCAKSGEEASANPEKSDAGTSSIGGTPGKSASYSVVNKNGFQVSMNVKQFAPNELSVKTIDNCIVVEGRHDDKEDGHGVISRHFVRKYMLPKGYDPNDVLSTLSSDGILTVKAPPPPAAKNDEPNERVIEIQPTPGPTPVVVASAKETPTKDTSKKVATSPVTRLEYQCPEKRQKLELPPESKPEENVEASVPIPMPPATAIENESDSASVQETGADIDSNDVEMEKSDEQNSVIGDKQTEGEKQEQQTPENAEMENDVEKKAEIIEQAEKLHEKEQEQILDETEKKVLDECMPESNGDAENVCEKMEVSCNVEDASANTENIIETPAESKIEEGAEIINKMEVDEPAEPQQNADDEDEKMVNSEIVVATNKKVDSETKTAVKAAANDDSAKTTNTDPEKTNNTDTSSSNATTTTTTTTITANNNNNSSTKTNSSSKNKATTNNSSAEVATENSVEDIKSGNGVVTGEIPADIPNSNDCEADITTTATKNTKDLADDKAESAVDEEIETETAVLSADTNTTTDITDDVALLKAATADPTSDNNTDENDILTESIDGITTTEDLSTTTTVDSVECSLFAKKAHLGNGNNTTATPIVGTEEMAN